MSAGLAFSLAGIAVFVLSFPMRGLLLRWGLIDRPNERSSHSRPTARGGGIAIILVVLALGVCAVTQQGGARALGTLLVAAAVLAIVSFADDLRSLPALVRLGCHGLAAVAALAAFGWPMIELGLSAEGTAVLPLSLALGLAFLWITGYTNAFNFMDGINGIAAGQAVVTGLGMPLLCAVGVGQMAEGSASVLLSLVIAGAALGFLPHNFPRARIFMGDVGSAPLGFLLAALVIWLAQDLGWWLLVPLALLHANFVLDTGITLVRRIARGETWYEPHREHFYQRLIQSGKSHTFVTLWEMGLQSIVLGLMVIYVVSGVPMRLALIALVLAIWLAFFAYCEIELRKTGQEQMGKGK